MYYAHTVGFPMVINYNDILYDKSSKNNYYYCARHLLILAPTGYITGY